MKTAIITILIIAGLCWISPTSHNDVDNNWTDEANAYDGSTGTYAYTAVDDTQHWLELILSQTISCDKIRIYADEGPGYQTDVYVDIDVYDVDSSGWVDVFNGEITKFQWNEKTIPGGPLNISKARVWWDQQHEPTNRRMYLKEFEFNSHIPIKMQYYKRRKQ